MADYSTSIRTQYIEPRIYQPNRQVEFRFNKNTLYQSNLKVTNLGVTLNTGVDVVGGYNVNYNPQLGVLGLIRHVRLMDGSRELSSLRHGYNYLAFKNINATNEQITDIHDPNHKSRAGMTLTNRGPIFFSNEKDRVAATGALNQRIHSIDSSTDADLGTVDLRICLPLLSSLPGLDTKLFPNLRLIIEFEDDPRIVTDQYLNGSAASITTTRPLLIADEVIGDSKSSMLRAASTGSFVWNEIQHDMFQVPDISTTANAAATDISETPQEVSAIVNGYDNKYVSRVLMTKNLTDKTKLKGTSLLIEGNGFAASIVGLKERLQVRSGGANLFTGDGLSNNGWKQMLLSETWGQITTPPFGALGGVGSDNFNEEYRNVNGVLEPLNFIARDATVKQSAYTGAFAMFGFQIEDMVKQLNFTYNRTALKDAGGPVNDVRRFSNMGLDVNIYGEVRRQLVIGKGGYDVRYV